MLSMWQYNGCQEANYNFLLTAELKTFSQVPSCDFRYQKKVKYFPLMELEPSNLASYRAIMTSCIMISLAAVLLLYQKLSVKPGIIVRSFHELSFMVSKEYSFLFPVAFSFLFRRAQFTIRLSVFTLMHTITLTDPSRICPRRRNDPSYRQK